MSGSKLTPYLYKVTSNTRSAFETGGQTQIVLVYNQVLLIGRISNPGYYSTDINLDNGSSETTGVKESMIFEYFCCKNIKIIKKMVQIQFCMLYMLLIYEFFVICKYCTCMWVFSFVLCLQSLVHF